MAKGKIQQTNGDQKEFGGITSMNIQTTFRKLVCLWDLRIFEQELRTTVGDDYHDISNRLGGDCHCYLWESLSTMERHVGD